MFMMLPDCIIELLVWTTLRLAFIGLISQLFLIFIYTPLRLMCRRMLWRIWGTPHWEEGTVSIIDIVAGIIVMPYGTIYV